MTRPADPVENRADPFAPPIEVQQRPDSVVLRLDLPGVEPEEVEVTVDNGNLMISGERRQEHREEREGLIRTEISYGSFHRAIPLPEGADEERMTAQLRNGTLEVTIPVVVRERGRRIPVQSWRPASTRRFGSGRSAEWGGM